MTNQPAWQCVANLGDADPYLYGGSFVMIDQRGVYDPELWIWEPTGENDDLGKLGGMWFCHSMDNCCACTKDGALISDNRFHPDYPAWWSDTLPNVATFIGESTDRLKEWILSSDPVTKAQAWQTLISYHGHEEFGDTGLALSPAKGKSLCRKALASIERSKKLKDGFNF